MFSVLLGLTVVILFTWHLHSMQVILALLVMALFMQQDGKAVICWSSKVLHSCVPLLHVDVSHIVCTERSM